jgi:hypothetical protein
MSSAALRVARAAFSAPRVARLRFQPAVQQLSIKPAAAFSTSSRKLSDDPHAEESFEEFSARYGSSSLYVCQCWETRYGWRRLRTICSGAPEEPMNSLKEPQPGT